MDQSVYYLCLLRVLGRHADENENRTATVNVDTLPLSLKLVNGRTNKQAIYR
jgi:hypothetical protein